MGDIDTSNTAFTGVKDTIYDSKVFKGLVSNSILPESIRIMKAQVAFMTDDLAGAIGNYAILNVDSGEQIHLNRGDQVVYFAVKAVTPLTSGAASINVGLGLTASGSVVDGLIGGSVAFGSFGNLTTGAVTNPISGALGTGSITVVGSNQWLVAQISGGALTAGVLQVVVMVV